MPDTIDEPTVLTVHYDGDSLRNHEIDVRQLSPALMGLATAFERAQAHVNPDCQIRLDAKATNAGSFNMDLIIQIFNTTVSALTSPPMSAALAAKEIGEFVFSGIRLLKNSKEHGGKPKKTGQAKQGKSSIKYPDGYQGATDDKSLELIYDQEFVQGIRNAVSPALQSGIDLVEFHLPDVSESVDTDAAKAISDYDVFEHIEMYIQVRNPSFSWDGKWRIVIDGKTQFVSLEDMDFKEKVLESHVLLGANDIYKVIMRLKKADFNYPYMNHPYMRCIAIEKVLEHRHPEEQ